MPWVWAAWSSLVQVDEFHMTERHFRLLLGLLLLALLYFEYFRAVHYLAAYLLFEAITDLRLPRVISRLLRRDTGSVADVQPMNIHAPVRFGFEAERALRVTIVLILVMAVWVYPHQLWWMAWFVGFALVGAGVSGICPMLTSLRILGFR